MKIHGSGWGHLLPLFLLYTEKQEFKLGIKYYIPKWPFINDVSSKGGGGQRCQNLLEKRRHNKLSEVIWSHLRSFGVM